MNTAGIARGTQHYVPPLEPTQLPAEEPRGYTLRVRDLHITPQGLGLKEVGVSTGMTEGEVETVLKRAEVDTGLKMVEGKIGMKKGNVKTRVMMSETDTEMMTEQLQLDAEPPSETRLE